jgi:hypothetical protein
VIELQYDNLYNLKEVEFWGLTEPETNTLKLLFARCKVSEKPENLTIGNKTLENTFSIVVDSKLPILQIEFDSYISYCIRNESFTVWDEYEVYEGNAFRIYSTSRFLDYVRVGTIASEDYPGAFKHYCIVCLDHLVDIVSSSIPRISEVVDNKCK